MISQLTKSKDCALYKLESANKNVSAFISTTRETREICNDPLCLGVEYTAKLRQGAAKTLSVLTKELPFTIKEESTVVTNILRGGLNFCLREALHDAFGWNTHRSAFLSAQRIRSEANAEDWLITEDSYKKVFLPDEAVLLLGDVVATGTSLGYALDALLVIAKQQDKQLHGIVFFTIGGEKTEEVIGNFDAKCRELFSNYQGSAVVYIEGRFSIPANDSPLSIAISGTDLLRRDSILAPEFFESQKEAASYPLERCTIYDAGSRAFYVAEYLEDVEEYWEECLQLAKNGMSFAQLLEERLPELDPSSFGQVSLKDLCQNQLEKIANIKNTTS